MKTLLILSSILFSLVSSADTPPPGSVQAKMYSGDGTTAIGHTGSSINVNISGGSGLASTVTQGTSPWIDSITSSVLPTNACQETGGNLAAILSKLNASIAVTGTFWQTTQPVSGTFWQATQPVSGSLGRSWTLLNSTDSVSAVQSGSWTSTVTQSTGANLHADIDNFPSSQAVTGTFWQATQPVSGTFWQTTQPVSGTVTANIGTSGSLALNTTVAGLVVAQGSTTSGQSGHLTLGAVTSSSPSYTSGQTSPFSLTPAGGLRVDGSGVTQPVSGTFWQATQPVSGTFWQSTQPVSLATLPSLVAGSAIIGKIDIDQTTPGTTNGVYVNNTVPVTGTFWQATQPVSAASLPLPSGAATSALQTQISAQLPTSLGAKTTANSMAVNIASDQTVPVSAASLPLPSGAATSALQTTINTTLGSPFQAGGSIGNSSFGISGTLPAFASTPTFNLGALNGAATSALQSSIQGSVSPGTAAINSSLDGMVYNSTTQSPTTGQQLSLQSDQYGNLQTSQVDMMVTGQSAQSATVNNILTATAGSAATYVAGFRSLSVQVNSTATGGTITFEGSNDNTNFVPILYLSQTGTGSIPVSGNLTPTATNYLFFLPITTNYVRLRISATLTGGSVQAFSRLSPQTWNTFNPPQSLAFSSNNIGAVNLGNPTLVADVTSAAITTTTTSSSITPSAGTSYQINIPVTAVSGTNPTLSVAVQESPDSGTNWYTTYTFPTITATGSYNSPVIALTGNRIRYVQTIGGTGSPSFTRAVNRLQSSISSKQPINNNATFATAAITGVTTLTAPQNAIGFILENLSSNTTNLFWTIGSTAATSTAGMLLEPGRDTGEIHSGQNISICPSSGTVTYAVQWIQQ